MLILKGFLPHLVSINKYSTSLTCDKNIQKQKIHAQAVWNKSVIFPIPDVLSKLNLLDRVLISQRIYFIKLPLC